ALRRLPQESPAADEQDGDRRPWEEMRCDQVTPFLTRLDPRLRAVYELHAVERLSYGSIAARLHVPMNTVATRLHRPRRALRTAILSAGASGTTSVESLGRAA